MSISRVLILVTLAGLILLGVGYYTGAILPLPDSYRPSYADTLTPANEARLKAARSVVSWIVDGKRIPGYDKDYPDVRSMKRQRRFVLVCQFVAEDAVLSTDHRVYRVDANDVEMVHRKYGYNDTDYITLPSLKNRGIRFVLPYTTSLARLQVTSTNSAFVRPRMGSWPRGNASGYRERPITSASTRAADRT